MPEFLQSDRYLYLDTPLGTHELVIQRFHGQEALSQLFEFKIEATSENAHRPKFEDLLGKLASFGIVGGGDRQVPRDFHGLIVSIGEGARDNTFTRYEMTVVPQVWMLTQVFQSRIFQQMTVPDILKKVLGQFPTQWELQGTFEPREYCVQYHESDFDFASRLMEEEGIYYYFKWAKGSHKMVVANTPQSHGDIFGDTTILYEEVGGGFRDEDRMSKWKKRQNWGSGKWTHWDHHFQLPHKHLESDQLVIDSVAVGTVTHKLKVNGNDKMEVYDFPGRYAQRFDGIDKGGGEKPADLEKIFQDNKRTTKIRMQQTENPMLEIEAGGNCWRVGAGLKFSLKRHFNADGQYVITHLHHDAVDPRQRSATDHDKDHYKNSMTCTPYALPYRPPRVTERPLIAGSQTAVVVGPPGEEIFPDKYGRVKVQFHWDREGKNDASSSCWLRVASPWAGKNWGVISLPRIGQEVMVDFLEGDPDRPIIVGSVYNADQMPPYTLPDKKTVATMKSRSSKGGAPTNYNEVRMEDLKGKEQLFLHAERDMDLRVKKESRERVGQNKHRIIKQNEKIKIEQSRHTEIVADEVMAVKGKRHTKITANDVIKIEGSYHADIGMSHEEKTGMKYAVDAGMEIHLKAGMTAVIEAGVSLTLMVGGNFINISPVGIAIQGTMVLINSGGAAGAGSGASPSSPEAPATPDEADDGTKFDKLG